MTAEDVRKGIDRVKRTAQLALNDSAKAPPVFVYQMGKVGSKSIARSLVDRWPGPVLHNHAIRSLSWRYPDVSMLYRTHLRSSKPVYVISPVREPISRNVSFYFESHGEDRALLSRETEFLMRHFLISNNHTLTLRWYDKFFLPYTGIDVYKKSLIEEGYAEYRYGRTRALILRIEMNDHKKEEVIADFLGMDSFNLSSENQSSEKWYAEKYRDFKENFRPPSWYVDMMYHSKFANHFYGDDKGAELRSRWRRRALPRGSSQAMSLMEQPV